MSVLLREFLWTLDLDSVSSVTISQPGVSNQVCDDDAVMKIVRNTRDLRTVADWNIGLNDALFVNVIDREE